MDEGKLTIFKAWLREEELSENTINSYVFAVNDFFTKYPVISKANLILWKQEMLEKKSPKTVNLRLCAIDRWIRFDGANVENVKRIRYQKQTTVENAMNFETYKRLIKCLEQEGNEKWIAYYKLLAMTGARISEALSLTKADLKKGAALMPTKGKDRRIYIPARLKEECCKCLGRIRGWRLSDFKQARQQDDFKRIRKHDEKTCQHVRPTIGENAPTCFPAHVCD